MIRWWQPHEILTKIFYIEQIFMNFWEKGTILKNSRMNLGFKENPVIGWKSLWARSGCLMGETKFSLGLHLICELKHR
jgi:hypothetical protein